MAQQCMLAVLAGSLLANLLLFAHVVELWSEATSHSRIADCRLTVDTTRTPAPPPLLSSTAAPVSTATTVAAATAGPTPPKPRFMGRLATRHAMPFFGLDALTTKPRANATVEMAGVVSAQLCSDHCSKAAHCTFWVLQKKLETCYLHDSFDATAHTHPWEVGLHDEWVSGPVRQSFVVWSASNSTLAARTLMVVNWHWGATGEKIVAWMVAQAALVPAEVDIVHAVPFRQTACLLNVWSSAGYLSQISLVVAHAALPGYRGYLFTNDDAVVFWDRMPMQHPLDVWHAGAMGNRVTYRDTPAGPVPWSAFAVPVRVLERGEDGGYVWGFDIPRNHESRTKRGLPSLVSGHSIEALRTLVPNLTHVWRSAGHADVVYLPGRYMDFASHWLSVLSSYGVFLEVAFASTIFLGLEPVLNATVRRFAYYSINGHELRDRPWDYYDAKASTMCVPCKCFFRLLALPTRPELTPCYLRHPAKLSNVKVRRWLYGLQGFDFGEPLVENEPPYPRDV